MRNFFKILLPFCISLAAWLPGYGQCGTPISVFPYQEDFEASDGGWTAGGTLSDWAWGTPAKALISSAGSGSKCWITGGLSGTSYNLGERSWIQSPCFDFTGLNYPYISFKLFWDTEKQYDGASIQFSTDGGTTWSTLGSISDPTHCMNLNWFNTPVITNLSGLSTNREGWSGNTQATSGNCLGGSGSGTWATASHCMTSLSGNPSVTFRFIFGAGTTCNDYDGFAFDLFTISEAPGIFPQIAAVCSGPGSIAFSALATGCAAAYSWNFGDPASGSNNTSTIQDINHTFSYDTTFVITLQARTPCGNAATVIDQVVFPFIQFAATPLSCPGESDGTLAVTVPNAGNLSYLWNVTPPNTSASISGLPGGTYSVTVTAPNTCPSSASYSLEEPLPLLASMTLLSAGCGTSSGSARVDISGGTSPYSFAWIPGGDTTATADGLNPGMYAVTVTDAGGCSTAGVIDIPEDCVNDVLFPSAFTPNGDGRNDIFYAAFVRIVTYEIRIFDRWGQLVFKSDDIHQPWDGTLDGDPVETGVYSYFASYSIDGIDFKEKKGRITLYY